MIIVYVCTVCGLTEDKCKCEKFCILCRSDSNVRLCQDGCYYCRDCREICDFSVGDSPEEA